MKAFCTFCRYLSPDEDRNLRIRDIQAWNHFWHGGLKTEYAGSHCNVGKSLCPKYRPNNITFEKTIGKLNLKFNRVWK